MDDNLTDHPVNPSSPLTLVTAELKTGVNIGNGQTVYTNCLYTANTDSKLSYNFTTNITTEETVSTSS